MERMAHPHTPFLTGLNHHSQEVQQPRTRWNQRKALCLAVLTERVEHSAPASAEITRACGSRRWGSGGHRLGGWLGQHKGGAPDGGEHGKDCETGLVTAGHIGQNPGEQRTANDAEHQDD